MIRKLSERWPWLRPLLPAAVIAAGWSACSRGEGPLVAFLGDSLTSGYRLREDEAYPALVARALAARGRPIRAVNAGKSGDTVREGLARLPSLLRLRPDVVVVALGTNDILREAPLRDAEAALDEIVAASQARGVRVLLVGVRWPAAGETRARAADELFARVAAGRKVPLVANLVAGVAGRGELLLPDLLHPNAAGQRVLAENVVRPLEVLLAEGESAR